MLSVNPGLVIWTIITFILLLVILRAFAWKPLLTALQRREEHIRSSINQAEQAKQEAEKLLEENRKLLANANEQSRKIITEGRLVAEKLKQEIIDNANQSARRIIQQAQQEIVREKELALQQLKTEVATLALTTAEKILGESLDETRHRKLIADFLRQLPKN